LNVINLRSNLEESSVLRNCGFSLIPTTKLDLFN